MKRIRKNDHSRLNTPIEVTVTKEEFARRSSFEELGVMIALIKFGRLR